MCRDLKTMYSVLNCGQVKSNVALAPLNCILFFLTQKTSVNTLIPICIGIFFKTKIREALAQKYF